MKYLDELERERAKAHKAIRTGDSYEFILDAAHRWSSWAAPKKADGTADHDAALTGPDLIDFVSGELFP